MLFFALNQSSLHSFSHIAPFCLFFLSVISLSLSLSLSLSFPTLSLSSPLTLSYPTLCFFLISFPSLFLMLHLSSLSLSLSRSLSIYLSISISIYLSHIYSVPHFCRYLSISLHGTTLTKWHFDTIKSSLCAAYITELIYFPLKI